jgi:glycosyltransferase involved in cell wall biosynthesis
LPHIVFVRRFSDGCTWGGAENRLLGYFANNNPVYNRITLAVTHDIFSERLRSEGISIDVIFFPFGFSLKSWQRFWAMFHFLKALKPDKVVYVQGAFTDFLLPDFLAGFLITRGNIFSLEVLGAPEPPRKETKKHFGFLRGVGLWWYKRMLPDILKGWLCKRILSVSQGVTDRLVDWYYFPKHRIINVYGGVDFDRYVKNNEKRKHIRSQFGISDSQIVVISTARLSKEKCLDRLISAFDHLSQHYPNVSLFLLGDGPERERLNNLVSTKVNSDKVNFVGFQEDVVPFLLASDIFVLPSDIEGVATALLEAMATQLVCIATATPGPSEILSNPNVGFLVDREEEAIFMALEKVMKMSSEERKKIGFKARQHIKERFSKEIAIKKFFDVVGLDQKR